MFKKVILALLIAATPIFFALTHADHHIEFKSVSDIEFDQSSNTTPFWRISIITKEPDVVNVDNGITIILPVGEPIQWDLSKMGALKLSGTAAGKIKDPTPTVSEDLYKLHLDVKENFMPNDELHIEGLTPITYKKSMSSRHLGLDITGDGIPELHNAHSFLVKSVARTDFIQPHDPADFVAFYDEGKKEVRLTWKNPRDYDFWQVAITRERVVNGKKEKIDVYSGPDEEFIDKSVIDGEVTYTIYAIDEVGNNSGSVKQILDIGGAPPPPPEPEPDDKPVTDLEKPDVTASEEAELKRLLNYYYIRYQIKCLAATAQPTSSLCLWSKIDLIYAQQVVGIIKANIYLTENDIRLMKLRVRWPEMRYQTKCVDADVPDKTCPALKSSLKRTHYFID